MALGYTCTQQVSLACLLRHAHEEGVDQAQPKHISRLYFRKGEWNTKLKRQ